MLWAMDAVAGSDRFRIQVRETATNVVVSDNLVNALDTAIPQPIPGGAPS